MLIRLVLLALLPALLFSTVHPSASIASETVWEARPDVPFVPTPREVVAEMLRLAEVRESDVLYDLGCGDGRIVITAVKESGARGVGVDIDPQRIEESRRNAARAGVSDRVEFVQEDLFTVDFSDATVVTLYLLPDVNLRLRPRLFALLEPGTRIVSHAFHMGEWEPDETVSVGSSVVYRWILPANASGEWVWSAPEGEGESYRLALEQHFQEVDGALRSGAAERRVDGATLEGDRLTVTVAGRGGETVRLEGRVNGDVIEGTMRRDGGETVPWRARRTADTISRVDQER